MSITPENPLRFPLLFDANLALKDKKIDVAFNYMEKLVHNSVYSRSQLNPSEKRLLSATLKHRVESLGEAHVENTEIKNVCVRILDLLDKVLIPSEGLTSETRKFYLNMKKDCYWYLAEARDGRREKMEIMTRHVWRI